MQIRTDLAVEAHELWRETAEETGELRGVKSEETDRDGYHITTVDVLDESGAQQLGKPVGRYVTVEISPLLRREDEAFLKGAQAVADQIRDMLKMVKTDSILVAGLGNEAVTPDAVGPYTARHTMATRHLKSEMPETFGVLRSVSVIEPGVLATTGMETAEVLKAVVEKLRPDKIIAVDALASRKLSRVCSTVQIADTGIVPGSGVGNTRQALSRETLGVEVLAVGVPTVVDAGTLLTDYAKEAGAPDNAQAVQDFTGGMVVTPKEIDVRVDDVSRLIGYAINLALHPGITPADIDMFMG